jgi:rSAM/selenodomain-associated transferase 2
MKLSIIIPCLNEAEVIVESLLRLQPLRQQSIELLLVDGGSSDNTRELAEPLVDSVLSSRSGRAIQMNTGAQHASGDYLLFLHADTYLPDSFLDEKIRWQSSLSAWGFFPVRLSGKHWLLRVVAWCMNHRSRLTAMATGDQAIFIRRDIWKQLEGFAEIPLMEDIELSRRLKHWRPYVARSRVITSSRRWEDNGMVSTILLMWWLRWRFFCGADPVDLKKRYH